MDFVKIYKDAWRILTSNWMLWAVCFPISLLNPLMQVLKRSPWGIANYFLIPILLFLYLFESVTVPYIILCDEKGNTCSFRQLWNLFHESLTRLISFYLIFSLLIALFYFIGIFAIIFLPNDIPEDWYKATWVVLSVKYLVFPALTFLLDFSFAGIALNRLRSVQALSNSILICFKSFKWILVTSIIIALINLITNTTIQAISGAAHPLENTLLSWSLKSINYYWYFLHVVTGIAISVFESTVTVLIYIFSIERYRPRKVIEIPDIHERFC